MDAHNCECCGQHQTLTVSPEGSDDIVCNIIGTFGVAETDYVALQPQGSTAVMIFRYEEDADGEMSVGVIESDEEYSRVLEAFDGMFAEDDFEDGFEYDDYDDEYDGELDDYDDELDDYDDELDDYDDELDDYDDDEFDGLDMDDEFYELTDFDEIVDDEQYL